MRKDDEQLPGWIEKISGGGRKFVAFRCHHPACLELVEWYRDSRVKNMYRFLTKMEKGAEFRCETNANNHAYNFHFDHPPPAHLQSKLAFL